MATALTFDELNTLYAKEHDYISMPYDDYFRDMDISTRQKNRRMKSARKLEDIFVWLLASLYSAYTDGSYDYESAVEEAEASYTDLASNIPELAVGAFFLSAHIPSTVSQVAYVAMSNPDRPFNFSIDRAMLIAENEANSLWNDAEFEEAVQSGKQWKTWHTILDKRTREWHAEVNGETKPIMEPFEVDGELMNYPRDDSLGASPENIANCRCSVSYS